VETQIVLKRYWYANINQSGNYRMGMHTAMTKIIKNLIFASFVYDYYYHMILSARFYLKTIWSSGLLSGFDQIKRLILITSASHCLVGDITRFKFYGLGSKMCSCFSHLFFD